MRLYNSIQELQDQTRTWMQSSCKELNSINVSEVVNFYVAASCLINKRLRELSDTLGISGFKESAVVTYSPYSIHNTALATCGSTDGKITVAFRTLLSYEDIDLILIHELSHIVYANHSSKFWSSFEYNIMKLGYVSPDYNGWDSRYDKNDETWDCAWTYNVEHIIFKGICNRRISILKYKIFAKGYHCGKSLFRNEIYDFARSFLSVYNLNPDYYHLYCNQLVLTNEI